MNGSSCPTCGWVLRWLPEQGAWGCDRCRKVLPASQVAPPQPPPAPGPSPYAPHGGPAPGPYSPHAMPPAPGYPMPPPGARSSRGLAIGLGVGAVVVAGAVVAIVLATRGGGGGSGASSREDLVKRALAAMGEGDVEELVKLSDPVALHNLALDCSERDKAKQDKDPDKDAAEDEPQDQDAGAEADDVDDDPQIQEKRVRRQHEKLVEKTKGMKIELVSLAAEQEDRKAKEGDGAEGTRKERRGTKKGDRAMKGCVLKVDVELHELVAKVRVTEAEGKQPSEQEAKLMAVHAGDSWFLMMAPKLAAGGGAIGTKLRGYRDRMCACKDAACAEDVHKQMNEWANTVRDDAEKLPKEEMKALDEIDDEMKACRRKLREGDEALREGDEGLQMKEALVQLEELRTKMCACADRACVERVQKEVDAWSTSPSAKAQVRREDMDKLGEITKALTDCMTKALKANPSPIDDPLPPEDGPDLASLPACAEYRRQIDRIRACPKYPPTSADAVRRGWAQLEKSWAGMRSNPRARDTMNKACETIADSLKKSLAVMCP